MAPPLLILQDIHLHMGTTPLLTGATLSVGQGERLALVGRNGSGKSTLLRIAAGTLEPERGSRFLQPGATLRSLPQEPDFGDAASTWDYVESGLGPNDDPYRGRWLLSELGLSGEEDPATLSGGEARRCALARALAPNPDILLLDEPTNHLDLPAIAWLEKELGNFRGALVLISHDRRFLTALSRAMVWLDRGTTRRIDQGFASFEAWRDQVLEEEESARHKLDRQIVREEHWMRYGVTARRKRNMRRVGELADLRTRRREALRSAGTVRMVASEGEGSGTLVAQMEEVTKAYGDAPPVVREFSTRVLRRDRVGIIGPNGAGKTTLLNLLTGGLQPDSGTIRLGTGLAMVTLDQSRESLDPAISLAEALTGDKSDQVHVGGQARHVVGYMKDFLFVPDQARTAVGVLSGGERGRLMLARAFAKPSNLLVLDEPTNDLDLETLDLLEELLSDYQGTALVVSHDRDFIDRVCTSVIVAEGEGRWQEYAGGYSDMVAQRGRGVEAKVVAGAEPRAAAARPSSPVAGPAPAKRKLNFKQQHALQSLPARMEALAGEIATIRTALAAPGLYSRDKARFERFNAALAAKEAELAKAEEEWLELEMLREAMEAG
ncbi:ABC-F family ATP-binding cassette domain-containing protein [Paeniroseomonas aquatica]|uniref:ABC-F family ATP-binding cassette domain-containing protein n=1 Tax=Paeniroseomonas aquatica TaxID=373043 RepID=A0ABT8A2C2_9PROT|nr:ABC-F family ATP-binding cassette domain-containing protein [Paeniroseomonas aquatica]MDN3563801.1 ABC-F family ATP-binding cassette domain-containing protein [Paeniroseomonas aquatica]